MADSQHPSGPGFDQLIDIDRWQPVEDYFAGADARISEDVEKAAALRKKLRAELLGDAPQIADQIKRPTDGLLEWARGELFGGRVCAVDGTVSRSPSVSGGRARVGVAAVSYDGQTIKRVLYVSYREMAEPVGSAIEYFRRLKKVNSTSELLVRAVMACSERALALRQPEAWRMVHGELLPFELWAALGKDRPLRARLDIGRRLIESKRVVAVVEASRNIQLLNAGELLEPGEYLEARDLKAELDEYRDGSGGRGAHFNSRESEEFREFAARYGPEVGVAIFKAGPKAYIMHAHRSVLEQAAALVIADASNQPLRGFPLLIDYADRVLHHYLAQGDFDRQIQFKTARLGLGELAAEVDPRKTRRR